MPRFALAILLALTVLGSAAPAEAQAEGQKRPAVIVTVTCDDLTATARARRPECNAPSVVRAPLVQVQPSFRPVRLADRGQRPLQRKILRMPWVIGAYQ